MKDRFEKEVEEAIEEIGKYKELEKHRAWKQEWADRHDALK